MEKSSLILVFIFCLIICILFYIVSIGLYSPYGKTEIKEIGDGRTLKIGVISDLQLDLHFIKVKGENNEYVHFIQALKILKEQEVEMIIIAGDLTDDGKPSEYKNLNLIMDSIYPDNKPELIYVMGNHDYWSFPFINKVMQKRFNDYLGQKPFTHKIINGYHFIGWGNKDGGMEQKNVNMKWITREIESAIQDDPDKYIFVITHVHPANTVYGSDDWGSQEVFDALKNYPQVINLSGHSHYSLMDDRSFWQKEFTAINTQSVAYIELEKGKENGSIPKDEFDDHNYSKNNYMGLIISAFPEEISIQRISLEKNVLYNKPWVLSYPINKENKDTTIIQSTEPAFLSDCNMNVEKQDENVYFLSFNQAYHENFVHSYQITFENNYFNQTYFYFSDFFLMKEDRKERITFKLPTNLEEGKYNVTIIAIESYGKKSLPCLGGVTLIK